MDPVAFKGGRAGFEVIMAPTTGVTAAGQGTEGSGYPGPNVGSQRIPAPRTTTGSVDGMGEGQQTAGSGITNFWLELPTPEEMWLAQEDFWVKRELLKVFGSIKRVREAPVEQIAAVPGISRALAERIKATLEA